jgi:hypothetical protein
MMLVAKVRTMLTIDEDVLKWVKIRAARTGVSDSAVIEESLRRARTTLGPLARRRRDYLLALVTSTRSYLVTGDQHFLGLGPDLPILTPAEFLTKLCQGG